MRSDRRARRALRFAAPAVAALLFAGCGSPPSIRVDDAWMRPVAVGQTTAAYFTLVNGTADSLVLVGVDVPAASMAMMHETVHEGRELSMREAERFAVPPHGRLVFAPGGNHVMAMEAVVALAAGDTTGLDLRFADGRRLHVTARVHT